MPNGRKVTVIQPVPQFTHRVGIYCRVSTKSQEQLNSLATQLSWLTRKVSRTLGWYLVDIYLDMKSGANASSRDEFQRMLQDCRDKKLDIIVTKSISRFGRNIVDTLTAINEARACNVEICFDQEDLSTKEPRSTFVISLIETVAQEESKARSGNISWGIQRRVENGTAAILNRKCYGYTHDYNGNLQIDEYEAGIVRSIFDLYLQGYSVVGIVRELEIRGVKSPSGKDGWCKRSVDVILSNEKYTGDVIVFKTYNAGFPETVRKVNDSGERDQFISVENHPGIITHEMFSAVQEEKERRSNIVKNENRKTRKPSRYSSKRDGPRVAAEGNDEKATNHNSLVLPET